MFRKISIGLLLLFSASVYAQKKDTPVVPKKERVLKQWNLSPDFTEEVVIPFDTAFSLYHRYRIADKFSPFNATLGNYGLSFYQLNFFDRVTDPDKFLYSNYYPFMYVPDKAVFMNTMVPFTELAWSFGSPRRLSEQTFRIRHSQNINRYLNFGFIYDIIFSLGQYNYQRAEDKNFTLYTSYTREKYKLYFSAGLNSIVNYENGGVSDVSLLGTVTTREIPVRLGGLDNAATRLKNKNLLLVQRYTLGAVEKAPNDTVPSKKPGFLGLSGTFSHIFTLDVTGRLYSDALPASGFYDTVYVDRIVTADTAHSRIIRNTLRFDFTTNETRKFRLGGGIGIRNELLKFYSITAVSTPFAMMDPVWKRNSNILVGRLYNNIGSKFLWAASGELFLTGYRAGDFNLKGEITKSIDFKKGRALWLITGGIINRQPAFWYEHWGSNHFKWNNSFDREFRIDVGTTFSYPARKTKVKFNYAVINNYTDFGLTATPSQYSDGLSVTALMLSKELRAWKFHLANDVLFQKSSNTDVLDLPLVTLRSAAYFEHLFKFSSTGGRLNTQLGADVTYNTLYHAYSYMPSTGRFYRQDKVSTGNYPFVNLFLNIKIKRTTIFLMFDHANFGFMGNNYDMVPSYLMNIRMFRYGLCWTFYD